MITRYSSRLTPRKRRANAFDLRYSATVAPSDDRWELCARVLSRNDIAERLTRSW